MVRRFLRETRIRISNKRIIDDPPFRCVDLQTPFSLAGSCILVGVPGPYLQDATLQNAEQQSLVSRSRVKCAIRTPDTPSGYDPGVWKAPDHAEQQSLVSRSHIKCAIRTQDAPLGCSSALQRNTASVRHPAQGKHLYINSVHLKSLMLDIIRANA